MPSFRFGAQSFGLFKNLMSLGSSEDNDIVLPGAQVADSHAHVQFDGKEYTLTVIEGAADALANGKKKRKHRLDHDDRVQLGESQLIFSLTDQSEASNDASEEADRAALLSYRKLHAFSERLFHNYDLTELLEALMDAVIEVTGAQKGFLILAEADTVRVKTARNIRKENLEDAVSELSDSIVKKVVSSGQPVIVSDAIHDAEFQNALSVMSLKLSSVMCVPLMERGTLLGAIYVGNDSVVRLFENKHLEVLKVFAAQAALILKSALLVNELKLESKSLAERIEAMRFGDIIGACPAMQDVFKKVQKVASTDISILITGETGTGKELIAREIHRRSPRAKGPFVTINCGAIPENLLESELFGHVKGAFTGAVANKPGKFHAADGGTLFLDEIGEMPVNLQVKILRALQERIVMRVGDTRPETVNIRVVAATHRTLENDIRTGRFREDLYYRLNVVNVHLPPLRDRGEDVVVIAKYLVHRYSEEFGSTAKGFAPNAMAAIRKFGWPGNIRQLENHIKKACVLAERTLVGPDDLGLSDDVLPSVLPLSEAKEKFQREYINQVLQLNNGNRTKTARDLGVDPRTIFRHLEKDEEGEPVKDA